MPPKLKFTKEKIIKKGFEIVQKKGWVGLTTRSLAAGLGSSAIPIYSSFKSMQDLEPEIIKKIIELQQEYMSHEFTGDLWHDHGIGYVWFAVKERLLFLGINDETHFVQSREFGQRVWDYCTKALADYAPFQGLSKEQIYKVQLKRWMMAHGLAFHACFAPSGTNQIDNIILHIQEGSNAILQGLKEQFLNTT